MKAKRIVLGVLLVALVAGVVFAEVGRKIPFKDYLSTLPRNSRPSITKVEETRSGARVGYRNTTGNEIGWLWMAVRAYYPDGTDEYVTDRVNFIKYSGERWVSFSFSKPSQIERLNVSVSDREPDNLNQ